MPSTATTWNMPYVIQMNGDGTFRIINATTSTSSADMKIKLRKPKKYAEYREDGWAMKLKTKANPGLFDLESYPQFHRPRAQDLGALLDTDNTEDDDYF